jgi:transcriptional regulator with XRE-family HTH domain
MPALVWYVEFQNGPSIYCGAMDEIGPRIRDARTEKGWTLETLAAESGLSASFLSQVERGLSTLSIVSLSSICRALGLPIESLFVSSGPLDRRPPVVTKSEQQLLIRIGQSPVGYRYLTRQLPEAPIEELLIAEFPPDCRQDGSHHQGEEFGYVLEGELIVAVDGAEYELSAGDSYRVETSHQHAYRTGEGAGARVLMAVTERFVET